MTKIIESGQRFSQSLIWQLQEKAYQEFGPKAWSEKGVPTYPTSHALTAKYYASLLISYLQDCVGHLNLDEPLYLFDLGAGAGRFCFVFLQQLLPRIERAFGGKLKILYIVTDCVEKNLEFIRHHSHHQRFFKEGILDCALFSPDHKGGIKLLNRGDTLTKESFANPLVLFANYFFDTIPQDAFRIEKGQLFEGRTELLAEGVDKVNLEDPALITKLRMKFNYVPVSSVDSCYSNPHWNGVLKKYLELFDEISFAFPTGAFQSIDYFSELSGGRLFCLAADQGVSRLEDVKGLGEPQMALHATFSVAINYHLIQTYFREIEGEAWLSRGTGSTLVMMAAALFKGKRDFVTVTERFADSVAAFETAEYIQIMNQVIDNASNYTFRQLLALIRLGNCDPVDFHHLQSVIYKKIGEANLSLQNELIDIIEKAWKQFYPLCPEEARFVSNLGALLFEMKRPEVAKVYFERASQINPKDQGIKDNLLSCEQAIAKKE